MSISIKNLSFRYNKNSPLTLNDISCSFEPGSINVLLGLNGCGKTTLIKLLAGLLKPISGAISYNEADLQSMPVNIRSKTFSYVPQKTYTADDYLVRDYLSYGFVNALKFYESPKEEHLLKIKEISKELNIEHLLNKKMGSISGGERQIVTIASCVLQNTPIILLDEPTSALDLKNQYAVLSLLKKISSEGKTIILSSHNPNHALFLKSNVFLMDNGNNINKGNAKSIINKETLKGVYGDNICYSNELEFKEVSFK